MRSMERNGEYEMVVRVDLDGFSYPKLAELFRDEVISIFEYDEELQSRGMLEWQRKMVIEGAMYGKVG